MSRSTKLALTALFSALLAPLAAIALDSGASVDGAKLADRLQLGDVEIKGESNFDGLRFSQRSAYDLKEKLKLRNDFMDRVKENVPRELAAEQK